MWQAGHGWGQRSQRVKGLEKADFRRSHSDRYPTHLPFELNGLRGFVLHYDCASRLAIPLQLRPIMERT